MAVVRGAPPGGHPARGRHQRLAPARSGIGIVGLAIPEEYGGLGQGFAAVGVVLEEAGAGLLCAPYFSSVVLAGELLVACDDTAAKQDYLPRIATGELRGT